MTEKRLRSHLQRLVRRASATLMLNRLLTILLINALLYILLLLLVILAATVLGIGIVGAGATLNGAPMRVSATEQIEGSKILASRSETKRGEFAPFEKDFVIEPVGSVAYKIALVAAGRGDSTFSLGPKSEWDVCAGGALGEAAGGRASARDGSPLRFNRKRTLTNGILAATAALHGARIELCAPRLEEYEFRFRERP